jgi:competence protein ComEC
VLDRLVIEGLSPESTPRRVRVKVNAAPDELGPGQWVEVPAVLRPPPPPSAPGAFDFQRQAFFEGLGGVGYAVGRMRTVPAPDDNAQDGGWRAWLNALRLDVARRVRAAIPGDSGAVAAALLTGKREAVPEPVIRAMRDSGLAHLLAISGLHLGLVAAIVFFGLRGGLALVPPVALRYPVKKWAAAMALLATFAYLWLAGATVPTQRAFVMTGLVMLAVLLDRTALSMRLVAWAAAVVLAIAPESLLGPSFQMSFAAVIALIAAYELARGFRERVMVDWAWPRRVVAYFVGVALTSLVAVVATAPFAIFHFNRLAGYGLLANLAAVPLTAFWIMPLGLAALILMPFGLEAWALVPMGLGTDLLVEIAGTVAGWPHAVVLVPAMPVWGLAAVALGGLWLCLWRQGWRLLGVAGLAAGLLSIGLVRTPDILVTGDTRLMAVRARDGGLLLSSARRNRFAAEMWLRRAAQVSGEVWPRYGASADGALRCDRQGCLYAKDGQVVAFPRHRAALAEDCRSVDAVVTELAAGGRACRGPRLVIDRFDLWRDGAHAIWIDGDAAPRVETVRARQGLRPWVAGSGDGDQEAGSD